MPSSLKRREHNGFPTREDKIVTIEVHVAGMCVRERKGGWEILAGKRAANRSLFPGKWECGGGMVRPNESFATAIERQIFEEFGLKVEPWFLAEAYEIHTQGKQGIIPGVRWVCLSKQGEVRLNGREFSEYQWLRLPLTVKLDWIGGLQEAIERITPRLSRPRGSE